MTRSVKPVVRGVDDEVGAHGVRDLPSALAEVDSDGAEAERGAECEGGEADDAESDDGDVLARLRLSVAEAELADSEDVEEDALLVGHLVGELEGVTCRGHGVLLVGSGTEDAVTDAEVLDVRPGFYDLADHGIAVFERAFGETHSAVEPLAVLVDGDVAVDANLRARADGGDVGADEQAVGRALGDVNVVEARLSRSGHDQSFQWMPPVRWSGGDWSARRGCGAL